MPPKTLAVSPHLETPDEFHSSESQRQLCNGSLPLPRYTFMAFFNSAAKKAFDAYKKENGSDKKLPRISELNAEYAMLLERKKSSYAEYRKTKSEMQDWLVAQKIVQEILKEDELKIEQLHEQEVRQEEENRQSSR